MIKPSKNPSKSSKSLQTNDKLTHQVPFLGHWSPRFIRFCCCFCFDIRTVRFDFQDLFYRRVSGLADFFPTYVDVVAEAAASAEAATKVKTRNPKTRTRFLKKNDQSPAVGFEVETGFRVGFWGFFAVFFNFFLPIFTTFYLVLPRFTQFYPALPSFFRDWPSFT